MLEMLVALTIGAVLAFLLARTLDSAIVSSERIDQSRIEARQLQVLRQLLHQDLQGIDWNKPVVCTRNTITFVTTHNHLIDAPLAAAVEWTARNGTLWRQESIPTMEYQRDMLLWPEATVSMKLDVFDQSRNGWVAAEALLPVRRETEPLVFIPEAFRITLSPQGAFRAAPGRLSRELTFIERIPHAMRPPLDKS